MRTLPLLVGGFLALSLGAPVAAQEPDLVTATELDAALESHAARVDVDRAVVARVLARGDVEAAAEAAGLGNRLADARAAAGQLDGERLSRAAGYARMLEAQLAGGQTISFSAVTIIIILLLVILVIIIAD